MANISKFADKAKEIIGDNKTGTIISATGLGIGAINLGINARRGSNERRFQKDQISATRELASALKEDPEKAKELKSANTKVLFRKSQKPYTQDPYISEDVVKKFRPKRKKSRQREYSIFDSTIKGAALGGTLAGGLMIFRKKGSDAGDEKYLGMKYIGGGLLIGAALGALVGTVLEISKKSNRNATVDARLMEHVIRDLKSKGFKEGVDFTRDPKQATEMKSKVCIVISKYSGELKLLINVVKDHRLENVTTQIIKNIPNSSNVVTREGDRFNDIIVSTISDGSADAQLIAGIAEKFIHNKYPIYLVEVG